MNTSATEYRELLWQLFVRYTEIVQESDIQDREVVGLCFTWDELVASFALRKSRETGIGRWAIENELTELFANEKPSYNRAHSAFCFENNKYARSGGWWFQFSRKGDIERLKFVRHLINIYK